MTKSTAYLCFCKHFDISVLSVPTPGYIHVYDHYFQISSMKPLCQSKPNVMWSLPGKDYMNLLKWSRPLDQDGRHPHIWQNL